MTLDKQPLARRIVIAFVLMTTLVSGVFSISIVGIVHLIEEHLVSQNLQRELHRILNEDMPLRQPPRLDAGTHFYASVPPGTAMPEQYASLPEGFNESIDEDNAFYLYVQDTNGVRYLLAQEQDEFEAREQALFDVVLSGFLLAVAGAWGLGWIMARKVLAPVRRLATQVRHLEHQAHHSPLAPEYADDEIGRLAVAFDNTLGQLHQALERERLFTSDVSHELRTPLMVIAGAGELLAQSPLSPQQQEQLSRIERASTDMRELVQTFLQLARGRDNDESIAHHGSLSDVAREQAILWGELARSKGLDFQWREEGPDNTLYNTTLLRAVMSNLLRNALHYTDSGHVRLVLATGGFRVEDSGTGIAAHDRANLFTPFVRGTSARGEGYGLGLSLVKRICAHQGWRIDVRDAQDVGGSCFSVTLAPP